MVEYEKMRNDKLKKNNTAELSPELRETIDDYTLQIKELDVSTKKNYNSY